MSEAVRPIYVLHGDDELLRTRHRQEILARWIGSADPQLCVASFDADATLTEVLDELRTLPFLAPRRVVVVRDADAFVAAYRDALEAYLESPAPTGVLVLMVSSWSSNTRLYKLVAKVGQVLDCSAPPERDLPAWIAASARQRGKKLSRPAADLLVEWVGADLALLEGEIEKLAVYAGARETIGPEDVEALVSPSAGAGAFDLTNALAAGDPRQALQVLDAQLTARGEEFKAIGMIGWHLRRAIRAKQQIQSGARPEDAVPRMPYPQRTAFLNLLKRRSLLAFQEDFRRLLWADLALKSGTKPRAALQQLVVGLCT